MMTGAARPLAIFDVDGTLIDSRHAINSSMQRAFQTQGLTAPSYDQTRRIVGLSLEEAMDFLAPRSVGPDMLTRLVNGYKTHFKKMRESAEDFEKPYAGIPELISKLKSEGWALGIATGKSRRGLDAMLAHQKWDDVFDCNYCVDDGAGKPDPFMVNANLSATGTASEHAVVIGDTSFDMLMARAANVTAFGVNWGFHNEDEIISGGANAMHRTVAELGTALDGFAASI